MSIKNEVNIDASLCTRCFRISSVRRYILIRIFFSEQLAATNVKICLQNQIDLGLVSFVTIDILEEMLGPNYTMDRLARRVTNSAPRICFLRGFRRTFVTLAESFLYQFHLSLVSRSSRLDERNISRKAHAVYMVSRSSVIQSIHDQREFLEER